MPSRAVSNPDSLGAALARQKWILLGSVLLSLACTSGAALFVAPQYQASARVMIDPSRYTLPGLGTEAEIVRSSAFAEVVIARLHLANDPEFTGQAIENKGGFLSLSVGTPQTVPPSVIEKFQHHLTVQPIAGSYVLVISFMSQDGEKAANIANAFADEYILRQQQAAPLKLQKAAPAPVITYGEQETLKRLLSEKAKLSARYGPKHPRMVTLEQEIATAREALDHAALPVAGPVVSQSDAATPSTSAKEGAKLVSSASVPTTPLRNVPAWVYGVAPFLGLMLGLLLAGLNEQLDRGFKTPRALEDMTGLRVAATVPVTKDSKSGLVMQKPSGPTAEAVRSLRAGLKLQGEKEGRQIKVVTVTSSDDGEARGLLGVWLGRLAARAGEKVLIVDANLRHPDAHTLVKHSNTPSLVDYLTGQNYLEQVIWKQDSSGAHMIFGSAVPNTALDLISSEKMKKLSNYLRQGYDLVIVIAPSCLASADAAVLANESDQTIYLVTMKDIDRSNVAKGLKLFEGFGYNALTLVMTDQQKSAA